MVDRIADQAPAPLDTPTSAPQAQPLMGIHSQSGAFQTVLTLDVPQDPPADMPDEGVTNGTHLRAPRIARPPAGATSVRARASGKAGLCDIRPRHLLLASMSEHRVLAASVLAL